MASMTSRRRGATAISSDARSLRLRLAQLDQDQADLERARHLWAQGSELSRSLRGRRSSSSTERLCAVQACSWRAPIVHAVAPCR